MKKNCPKCNTSNPAEANYCRRCGTKFDNNKIDSSSIYLQIKIAEAKETARMISNIINALQNNKLNHIISGLKQRKKN